ncbi:MAG: hypothetical protein K6G36_02580 [Candidatus Saccharibacteria bacterium]|nr:hypothetical protein [Candidatus Saccharibacteria bacterium]
MDQNPTPVAPAETPAAAPAAPAAKGANKNLIIGIVAAIVVVVAIVVVLIVVLGGNKSGSTTPEGGSGSSSDTSLSKCGDAFKCLEKIDENATVESINELTGIEGKTTSWSDTVYEWEFPNGESLELSTSYFNIKVDYDTDLHKDSSVNFDGYEAVKDQVRSGITKDALAEALGSKGLLYEKSSTGSGYLWVDADGGYLRASVSSKGNVTFVSGWF